MANARTRFDTICEYMVRAHGASIANQYGKPCATVRGHAFIYFHQDWAAFRLAGRVRLQATALSGVRYWSPLGGEPSMEWVIVPDAHFLRWDRFAVEAVKQVERDAGGRRPQAGPAQGPAPLPPASVRWLDGIKSLLARAASLTLAQQEPVPERAPSRLFDDDSPPDPKEAEAFAGLAAAAPPQRSAGAEGVAAPVAAAAVSAAVAGTPAPSGRASFAVGADPAPAAAPAAAPSGRASFNVGTDPVPPAPPPAAPAPPAAGGRASFAVGADPAPPPPPAAAPAAVSGANEATAASPNDGTEGQGLAAWEQRIARYRIAEDPATPAVSGRAVFEAREVEPPSAEPRIQVREDKPLGRASFLLPDDEPPPKDAGDS